MPAAQAPDLRDALERAQDDGLPHVIPDGTIIPADRCKGPALSAKGEVIDLWYSGKAHNHGGNIQAALAPAGSRCGSQTPCNDRQVAGVATAPPARSRRPGQAAAMSVRSCQACSRAGPAGSLCGWQAAAGRAGVMASRLPGSGRPSPR